MGKISYVNGRYLVHKDASVHIEDRGFQFADGVYEVILVKESILIEGDAHLKRLRRSAGELQINFDMSQIALELIVKEVLRRNKEANCCVYIQVTRGVAKRKHEFATNLKPSLIVSIINVKMPSKEQIEKGVSVITMPDIRWGRCDIKSVSLLANSLAKQKASNNNAREAWLVNKENNVTEGSASNSFIIKNKTLITHNADQHILNGITRNIVLDLAKSQNYKVEERPFSLDEAFNADEAFLTTTSAGVLPVISIDGKKVANGLPGKISLQLANLYDEYVDKLIGEKKL